MTDREILIYDIIIFSVKRNFVLEPVYHDDLLASKVIEGNKLLPHMVVLLLCQRYKLPLEIPYLHLRLSEQRYNELVARAAKLISTQNLKFINKVRLCYKLCSYTIKQLKK